MWNFQENIWVGSIGDTLSIFCVKKWAFKCVAWDQWSTENVANGTGEVGHLTCGVDPSVHLNTLIGFDMQVWRWSCKGKKLICITEGEKVGGSWDNSGAIVVKRLERDKEDTRELGRKHDLPQVP